MTRLHNTHTHRK